MGQENLNATIEKCNVRHFSIRSFRKTFGFGDTAFESLGKGEIALEKLSSAVLVDVIFYIIQNEI